MAKTVKQIAAEAEASAINNDRVMVRITKLGDGEVSTGEHIPGEGDLMHEKGDIVSMPRQIAEALEVRGFVEIEDEKPAVRRGRPPNADLGAMEGADA